jgi:superfamily I DNA/RNA helicase
MITKVILGGPGTGKTYRLLQVLKEELALVPAEQIAYVSYTRQGTYQGVSLAKEEFDLTEDACRYFRTLHSIAFRHLKATTNDMMSAKDYAFFSEKLGVENWQEYLKFEELQRNNAEVAALIYNEEGLDAYTAQYISLNYKKYKEYYKKKDFSDLLEHIVDNHVTLPVSVAIIDEAQDLTTLQWKAVRMLFKDVDRLYIAGDPNQAIYDWAGADYKYFMKMSSDSVEVLETTYRLPRKIWELGKKLHAMIDESTPYPNKCVKEEGVLRELGTLEHLVIDKRETYLFIARAQCYLLDIEEALQEQGILYTNTEGECSVKKKYLKIVEAWFTYKKTRVLTDEILHALAPTFGENVVRTIRRKTAQEFDFTFLDTMKTDDKEYLFQVGLREGYTANSRAIRITTMHKVKGAEADNVYVLLDATRKTMLRFQDEPDAELRVLYVALTRAKHRLFIVRSSSKYSYPIMEIGQGSIG